MHYSSAVPTRSRILLLEHGTRCTTASLYAHTTTRYALLPNSSSLRSVRQLLGAAQSNYNILYTMYWWQQLFFFFFFFIFLLDSTLIMGLCEILYTVAGAALAQRPFRIKNRFFKFCALYYNCFQCKNSMSLFLLYFPSLLSDSSMTSQLEIDSVCSLRVLFE